MKVFILLMALCGLLFVSCGKKEEKNNNSTNEKSQLERETEAKEKKHQEEMDKLKAIHDLNDYKAKMTEEVWRISDENEKRAKASLGYREIAQVLQKIVKAQNRFLDDLNISATKKGVDISYYEFCEKIDCNL